jgi:hypothetical protein
MGSARSNAFYSWILKTAMKTSQEVGASARRLLLTVFILCKLLFANSTIADVVPASDNEWQALALVTGFHNASDPNSDFQVRLLESNGKATVAMNPIGLFIVITNNSSAGDLQQHIYRLPITVAQVKRVTPTKFGVFIIATLDAVANASIKPREVDITVRYEVLNGVLKDTITMQQELRPAKKE